MAKFQITYRNALAELAGLEKEVEADRHRINGRFLVFYKDEEVVLQVAAAQVLQVKRA